MDNNLSAPIKKRHLRQLTILNNERRDIMDRLFEGDRFCNRPTVSLQFGPHHHVKITSCYPANFSSQVGSSCWTRLPWIILGIGVGISNMVYHTYTLKMVDSNVRDALTTLSILFESLMSFSIGSFMRVATLVEILLYVSISSIWLLAIFLESPLFLMRKSCMIEAYEAISFFKNTSKRGTKNYERVEVEKVVTRSIAEQYALYIAFLLIAVQHFRLFLHYGIFSDNTREW